MSILFLSGILSFSIVLLFSVCVGSAEEIKRVSDSSTSLGVGTCPDADVHKSNTLESEIETDITPPTLNDHPDIAESSVAEEVLTNSSSENIDAKSQASEEKLNTDNLFLVFGYASFIGGIAYVSNRGMDKSALKVLNLR